MAKRKKASKKKKAVKKARPKRTGGPVKQKTAGEIKKEYKPHYASVEHFKPRRAKHMVVGIWALILAIVVSVMLALVNTPYLPIILVALGFIVGFVNIEHEETVKFLVATISMLIIASALLLTGFSRLEIIAPVIALYLKRASYNVIAVVAPAAFVISLKALRELAE